MSDDAVLLSSIALCWQAERVFQPQVGSERVDVEALMVRFRMAVHTLVDHYLPEGERPLVFGAYDAGVASGFYGPDSAIAVGLRQKRNDSLRRGAAAHALCAHLYELAYQHGRALRSVVNTLS